MTGPEIVKFSDAVSAAYQPNELTTLLLKLNRRFLDHVNANAPFPQQVVELVGAANSQGWISQLALAVVDDRPNIQPIKDFLTLNPYWDPSRYPPLAHPADTLRVYGGKSFIGRSVLRSALKKMNTPTGKKVLVVTSTHRLVGKTYSRELINFVSKNLQPSFVAHAELDEKYDPIKLTKKLAKDMRLNPSLIPDDATEQAPRTNQDLVPTLLTTDNTNPQPVVWIVLDGFRQAPSESIRDFIERLAEQIQSMVEFRLILLNYPSHFPPQVGSWVIKDELEPLTRTELETHFINVHRQKHNANPSPAELSDYLTCMDDAFEKHSKESPEEKGNLLLVNRAVTDVVETIEEDAP